MISGIEVGRRVVCVDAKPRKPPYEPLGIYEKAIYTITAMALKEGHGWGVGLAEVKTPFPEGGFCADRFRPVRETSIEALRALLDPRNHNKEKLLRPILPEAARRVSFRRGLSKRSRTPYWQSLRRATSTHLKLSTHLKCARQLQ